MLESVKVGRSRFQDTETAIGMVVARKQTMRYCGYC
jgi:hypothetical protein